jgi:DNA-binding helix-hairpin-helix protein with protein kinase domain
MSEKLIEVIADALTNEVVELELSAERIAELKAEQATRTAEQEARIAAKESALAKLAALGLTEEEIAAL